MGAQRADSVRTLLANGALIDEVELRVLRCLEQARRDSGVRELLASDAATSVDCDGVRFPLERVQ